MLDLIRRLQITGYVTATLSDQTHRLDELDARQHFNDPFDHVFNSYYRGKGKRAPSLNVDLVLLAGTLRLSMLAWATSTASAKPVEGPYCAPINTAPLRCWRGYWIKVRCYRRCAAMKAANASSYCG
jgi:hypothetical protein